MFRSPTLCLSVCLVLFVSVCLRVFLSALVCSSPSVSVSLFVCLCLCPPTPSFIFPLLSLRMPSCVRFSAVVTLFSYVCLPACLSGSLTISHPFTYLTDKQAD